MTSLLMVASPPVPTDKVCDLGAFVAYHAAYLNGCDLALRLQFVQRSARNAQALGRFVGRQGGVRDAGVVLGRTADVAETVRDALHCVDEGAQLAPQIVIRR